MKKISVLQLCHSYGAPFDDVARQWRVLFDPERYQVVTVFLCGEPNSAVENLVGAEVVFLNYRSKDLRGLKRKQKQAVRDLHQRYDFKLIIAQRYKPIFIASAIKAVPIIGVAHAYGVFARLSRRMFVYWQRQRLWLVGVSEAICKDIGKAVPKISAQRLLCIHNRIDTERHRSGLISRHDAREHLKLDQDALVFSNVGRLHPDKDQHTLLKGFALWLEQAGEQAHNARLIIIGTGRLEHELKQLAAELGLGERVIFYGYLDSAWRYYKAFDGFILSSNYEPFGMVLLEAMIAGVPVIATNVGGAAEVVADPQCLFGVREAEDLARALNDMCNREQLSSDDLVQHVQTHFSDQAIRQRFNAELQTILPRH